MTTATQTNDHGRIAHIMESHAALPTWVKIWMNFILGPVNLASLVFISEPRGALVAALAIGGMVLTVIIVMVSGGFTKLAAAGHILVWTPLVLMLVFSNPAGSEIYQMYLMVLLIVNSISLAFDYNDIRLWLTHKA